jgi:hypothetical protein
MKKITLGLVLAMACISVKAQLLNEVKNMAVAESQEMTGNALADVTDGAVDRILDGDVVWGIRANGLINTTSLGDLENAKNLSNHGFNVGVSARFNFDDTNLFVNPELYYTHLGKGRLDLPILGGYQLSNTFALIAGPTLAYIFSDNSKEDLVDTGTGAIDGSLSMEGISSKLTFGYQAGLQAYFNNFVISAKYDGSFTGQVVDIVNTASGAKLQEEVKTSFISIGIGYNFGS